jgi:IstB-like ATP binding protein
VRAETEERSRRGMGRRLRYSGIKGFKPMADFDWSWPTRIERDVIERALTLDFLSESRNLVLVGRNGLGKTMIAQNICHAAVLAGSSVLFRSAPALLEELHRQTPEGRRRKLRSYANVGFRQNKNGLGKLRPSKYRRSIADPQHGCLGSNRAENRYKNVMSLTSEFRRARLTGI